MLYAQKLTAQVFVLFLERLIAKRTRSFDVDQRSLSGSSLWRSATVATWASWLYWALLAVLLPAVESGSRISIAIVLQGVHFLPPTRNAGQVKRAASVSSAQTAKVTCSNHPVFQASFHPLCCLNKCSPNHCRVNKRWEVLTFDFWLHISHFILPLVPLQSMIDFRVVL